MSAVLPEVPDRSAGRTALRWGACLGVVLALHGGLLALLGRTRTEPPPQPPADAVMIEMAPAPEIPAAVQPPQPAEQPPPPQAAPPSPPLPEAQPQPPHAPEPVQQPAPPDPVPEDVLVPEAPAAPAPEVVLPPKPKPRPVPPKHAPPPRPAARPVPDPTPRPAPPPPQAAAPTAAEPAVPAAPSPQLVATWQSRLIAHIARFKSYPLAAQRRGEQGVAYVRFVIDREGNVLTATLARGSGHPDLDREATAWLERAQPLPKPPPEIARDRMELVLPMRFELQ